jgi:large subunit ribosomal protein L2
MAIKVYKKNTAGRRGMSIVKPEQLTDKKPEKSLVVSLKNKAGRSHGKISIRHRGGANRRKYRLVDFKMNKLGIPCKVSSIEKDPNRSALIALVVFADGEKRYVLATDKMRVGQELLFKEDAPIKEGNRVMMKNIPVGTAVSNIEMIPGKGGQMVRSAGSSAVLQALDAGMAYVKLSSSEVRMVRSECFATIGQVSNFEHSAYRIGKAGRKRHMGWRPVVRGTAMNPVDHPHGGGEGLQPIGLKYPKTPWGKPALGKKTRKKNKQSSKFIIQRRKHKK